MTTKKTNVEKAKPEVKKELFVCTHGGTFFVAGAEFKQGNAIELSKEQQEKAKLYIDNGMIKAV